MGAAGPAGLVRQLFAADLVQVVGGFADGVVVIGLSGDGVHFGGELGDGEPGGAVVRASAAVRAARMRGLFRSMPPTQTAPIWDGGEVIESGR